MISSNTNWAKVEGFSKISACSLIENCHYPIPWWVITLSAFKADFPKIIDSDWFISY